MLTKEDWWLKVRANHEDLRQLVADFHPASKTAKQLSISGSIDRSLRAFAATRRLRDPLERFDESLIYSNGRALYHVLNEVFYGTPAKFFYEHVAAYHLLVDLTNGCPSEDTF